MTSTDHLTTETHAGMNDPAANVVRQMFVEYVELRARHGAKVINLAIGQPLPPVWRVFYALFRAMLDCRPDRFAYPPNLGWDDVREHVSHLVNFPGMSRDAIVMTPGASAAISLAIRAFVQQGMEILGVVPHFAEYATYAHVAGHPFTAVMGAGGGALDLAAIDAKLSKNTGAIILTSPGNPGGHVLTHAELTGLASLLKRHHDVEGRSVLLIVDEVYAGIVYPPAVRVEPFIYWPFTVLARSMSKGPGLAGERGGFLALHPELVNQIHLAGLAYWMRALAYVNAPSSAQLAWLHMPSDVGGARYLELRDFAHATMVNAGLDVAKPDGGIYLWARTPPGWRDTKEFVDALRRELVIVVDGAAFGDGDFIRICFATTKQNLERAARVIHSVVLGRQQALASESTGVAPNGAGRYEGEHQPATGGLEL